jgi:arylformamidase
MLTALLPLLALASEVLPPEAHRAIAYADRDPAKNLLDLYVPPRAPNEPPLPVLIWVHGGGWQKGSREQITRDKASFFMDRHAIVVSVDYRLADGSRDVDGTPIRFPDFSLDVADAIRWTMAHAAEYGGDPRRVTLMGFSAGAHLVALAATDPQWLGPAREDIQCVAVLDVEALDIPTHMANPNLDERTDQIFRAAFGDDPADWAAASPITHVVPTSYEPDFFLVHRGSAARRHIVDLFQERVERAGSRVTLVEAGWYEHEQVNRAIGMPGETVLTPYLAGFLDRCLHDPPRVVPRTVVPVLPEAALEAPPAAPPEALPEALPVPAPQPALPLAPR